MVSEFREIGNCFGQYSRSAFLLLNFRHVTFPKRLDLVRPTVGRRADGPRGG
jgi:hypothetical protein